jgi:hypothetical protein
MGRLLKYSRKRERKRERERESVMVWIGFNWHRIIQ